VTGAGDPTAVSRDGGQRWDPERYARNARFVAELGEPALDLLEPAPGERILDLGCGDGVLAKRLVAAGARVVAVDASAEQVAAARGRGLDAHVADGEALAFRDEFDAVFSNAALHWMRRPDAVIGGVWRALKPGGRFVGEFGGHGNVDSIRRALHAALARRGVDAAAVDPWYFPTVEDYEARLARVGFQVRSAVLVPRPTPLPGSLADWLDTFAGAFLDRIDAAARPAVAAEVSAALEASLRDAAGRWSVPYVRLRFAAAKPAAGAGD